ncbi:AAA family ATPase [uncultured Selenomonas sp.]|uniref:AAA family ATPase n=1 Tax=uncultured Selenomonas sp. TaxID=159275 RepID=UPI0025F65330|nr:AAA family ATPase [uncultured Selenomonas sp.]
MPNEEEHSLTGVVITFFSTASSVGKTLISCNMASELARQGARVVLCDLDLQFGDICNYLHLAPDQTIADAQRCIELQGTGFDVRECLAPYSYEDVSFSVLAAPKELAEAYNMKTETIRSMIESLQRSYDYVILDTTSMFSELNVAMLDLSTIVTFLGVVDFIPTIKNMKIGFDMMNLLKYETKMRVVLNRSNAKTRIAIQDVEKLMGQQFYHILPNDFRAATQSIQEGVPLVLRQKDIPLTTALRDLVARYTNRAFTEDASGDEAPATHRKTSWFEKIFH